MQSTNLYGGSFYLLKAFSFCRYTQFILVYPTIYFSIPKIRFLEVASKINKRKTTKKIFLNMQESIDISIFIIPFLDLDFP